MTRSANQTPPSSNGPGLWLTFRPAEWAILQHNVPGPSGDMGGYQMLENRLRAEAVPPDHRVFLTPVLLERLIRYLNSYKGGGPNARLRRACPNALARVGIVLPKFFISRSSLNEGIRAP